MQHTSVLSRVCLAQLSLDGGKQGFNYLFLFYLIIGCLKGIVATTRKSNDPLTWLIGSKEVIRGHGLNGLFLHFSPF